MFIAADMTLAGVPARKMPDNWPYYDVVAQPAVVGLRREFLAPVHLSPTKSPNNLTGLPSS
jgi:hypothetical protein